MEEQRCPPAVQGQVPLLGQPKRSVEASETLAGCTSSADRRDSKVIAFRSPGETFIQRVNRSGALFLQRKRAGRWTEHSREQRQRASVPLGLSRGLAQFVVGIALGDGAQLCGPGVQRSRTTQFSADVDTMHLGIGSR